MTKKTEHLGREAGNGPGNDKWLSPSQPYTGDGKTTRSIFDRVSVVFKGAKNK